MRLAVPIAQTRFLDTHFHWRSADHLLSKGHHRLVECRDYRCGGKEAHTARGFLADVSDAVGYHLRNERCLAGGEPSRLLAQTRLNRSRENQQDLLCAIGVGAEVVPWLDLEVDDRGALGACGRVKRKVYSDTHCPVILIPGVERLQRAEISGFHIVPPGFGSSWGAATGQHLRKDGTLPTVGQKVI